MTLAIRELVHDGLAAVELETADVRMVVVTSTGPRIAWFGFRDRANLLYWDTARAHHRGDWQLLGGHRLWVTRPGADESEEIYAPEPPCTTTSIEGGVRVTTPPTSMAIEKSLAITVRGDQWRIEHRLRNVGELLWSGGAWALTCTLPARSTRYRIPLGGGPSGWDHTVLVIPTKWGGGHTSRLDDPQIVLSRNALEVEPSGEEGKRMILAPQGAIEMDDPERGLFRKQAAFVAEGAYPLNTNLAIYLGPERFMVELETMGPTRTLAPGATLDHVESWTLRLPAR